VTHHLTGGIEYRKVLISISEPRPHRANHDHVREGHGYQERHCYQSLPVMPAFGDGSHFVAA
jgi:hypothetical protein